jgi:hypothetical protein
MWQMCQHKGTHEPDAAGQNPDDCRLSCSSSTNESGTTGSQMSNVVQIIIQQHTRTHKMATACWGIFQPKSRVKYTIVRWRACTILLQSAWPRHAGGFGPLVCPCVKISRAEPAMLHVIVFQSQLPLVARQTLRTLRRTDPGQPTPVGLHQMVCFRPPRRPVLPADVCALQSADVLRRDDQGQRRDLGLPGRPQNGAAAASQLAAPAPLEPTPPLGPPQRAASFEPAAILCFLNFAGRLLFLRCRCDFRVNRLARRCCTGGCSL